MSLTPTVERKEFILADLSGKVQQTQLDHGVLNKVNISSLISFDHIFVQKIDAQYDTSLKNIDAMDLRFASLRKPKCISTPIQPNALCIVKHNGRFYRALTVEVGELSSFVMFADFGGIKQYNNRELYLPLQEFVEFPIMAVECIVEAVAISYDDAPFVRVPAYSNYHLLKGEHYVRTMYEDMYGLMHVELYIKYQN